MLVPPKVRKVDVLIGVGRTLLELAPHLQSLLESSSERLDAVQSRAVQTLLSEFEGSFASSSGDKGRCAAVRHTIDVGDHAPIKQAPRRLPLNGREEVARLVEEMLANDVIEPSSSPWASPIVLVKKKDGSKRFCVDYRRLNEVTKKDSYPLPRIHETLDLMAGAGWFSTIDLQSGYWQVAMDPQDKEKTAFVTGQGGLWQFKVMPFGLSNTPATFERMMETVLQGLTGKICLVYLDDVIVFGKTFEEEEKNLKEVFSRLRRAGLKMSPKKCHLFQREVNFLGHVVSAKGVTTDPTKIEKVANWPRPTDKEGVQSFIGLCMYYRKFVKGFATIARPLHHLTGNKTPFEWTPECEEAFDRLKTYLTTPPILASSDTESPFILDTDASLSGIGGILSQVQGGHERVVSYYSRVLSKTEKNYCVTRRELLAVVKAVVHFHHYLYGREFLIRTDHASLQWLLSFKSPEGQVARWVETLGLYVFKIEHRAGLLHGNADALSRRPCDEAAGCKQCLSIEKHETPSVSVRLISLEGDGQEWETLQRTDDDLSQIRTWKESGLRSKWQEVASTDQSLKIYWAQWDSLHLSGGLLYRK